MQPGGGHHGGASEKASQIASEKALEKALEKASARTILGLRCPRVQEEHSTISFSGTKESRNHTLIERKPL